MSSQMFFLATKWCYDGDRVGMNQLGQYYIQDSISTTSKKSTTWYYSFSILFKCLHGTESNQYTGIFCYLKILIEL